jgi:hypothetical protein
VRPRALTVCTAAAMVIGGCGGGGGKPTTPATTASAVGPSQAAVRIVTPEGGSSVRAHRASAGGLSASVTVTGDADALQTVKVDGGCAPRSCTRITYTGAKGHWTARLRVVLPSRSRRLTLTADYAVASGPTTAAKVSVAVHAVKARAPARPRHAPTTTQEHQPSPQTAPATPPPSAGPRRLVLVGDSLAVGVRALLPAALPGWKVEVLGRVGRPLAEGMSVLEGLGLAAEGQSARPVVAVSLFTNDDPTHTAALQAAVRTSLELAGARGCAIWATIAAPPVNGVSYRAANTALERLADADPRLVLVPWAEQTASDPSLLGSDGVHPTPAGYRLRARLYAEAAQACRS